MVTGRRCEAPPHRRSTAVTFFLALLICEAVRPPDLRLLRARLRRRMRRSAGHMFPHGRAHGACSPTATAGNTYRTGLVRAPRSSCSASPWRHIVPGPASSSRPHSPRGFVCLPMLRTVHVLFRPHPPVHTHRRCTRPVARGNGGQSAVASARSIEPCVCRTRACGGTRGDCGIRGVRDG